MNTEKNLPAATQENLNNQSGATVPPAPIPEMPPAPSESKLSSLRVAVVLVALLVLAGGAVYFISNQIDKQGGPTDQALITNAPTLTSAPAGLKLSSSDDPELLEQELNDINLEELNQEEAELDQEMQNL